MRPYLRLLSLCVALVALAGGIGYWAYAPGKPVALDTQALFAASFTDANKQTQALRQWRGQVLVVNFWATWCPPCREEMPQLSALQESYRARGLIIIGIATDEISKMREFARLHPSAYPLLAADIEAVSLMEALGNKQGVLPYTVLLDRNGEVAATYIGRLDLQQLERDVRGLLDARAASSPI